MHATGLVHAACSFPSSDVAQKLNNGTLCKICGEFLVLGVSEKEAIKDTFNNVDLFKHESHFVCQACAFALSSKFRYTSFVSTTDEYTPFKNDALWRALIHPPNPPFVFCVTESFHKHNLIRAEISEDVLSYTVRFEDKKILFNRASGMAMMKAIAKLYYGGFTREEILCGATNYKRIMDYGVEAYRVIEEQVRVWRGEDVFEMLIIGLSSSKKEIYRTAMAKKQPKKEAPSNDRKNKRSSQVALFDLEAH